MTVKIDQPVPDFDAAATDGVFRLKEHLGHVLILYFYPKDDTPGCATEGSDFRDRFPAFKDAGVHIFGISRDTLASHHRFREKLGFPFALISDPDEKVCELFRVMKDKFLYGKKVRGIERSTFLIDRQGVLRHEWRGVKVAGHVEEVLASAQRLHAAEPAPQAPPAPAA